MKIMRAQPRLRVDGKRFKVRSLAASGLIALLAACGGGGDSGGTTATSTPQAPETGPAVGDYYVYAFTSTPSVPANASVMAYNNTVAFKAVSVDGSNERMMTYGGTSSAATSLNYTASGAQTSFTYSGLASAPTCTFSLAAQFVPPFPRSVGQAWAQTTTRTCTVVSPAIQTVTQTGQVTLTEDVTVPAGTFASFKAERNSTSTSSTETITAAETCWYAVTGGMTVRCVTNTTVTPAGASAPSQISVGERVLIGYGGPNKLAQGNRLARFHGVWRVVYTGSEVGVCPSLSVTAAGMIIGSCAPTGGAAFNVTGSVTEAGVVSVVLPNGGTLSGTLARTYSGSGTWLRGTASGSWTATHN